MKPTKMKVMFEKYLNTHVAIKPDEFHDLPQTQQMKYVQLHSSMVADSTCYMTTDMLHQFIINIWTYHMEDQDYDTEPFNLVIDKAGFVLYIDLDFYITGLDKYDAYDLNSSIASHMEDATQVMISATLGDEHSHTVVMTFVPRDVAEDGHSGFMKGGVHIFVYFPCMIVGDDREECIAHLFDAMDKSDELKALMNEHANHLVDHQSTSDNPIRATLHSLVDDQRLRNYSAILFPFAQKDFKSRTYGLKSYIVDQHVIGYEDGTEKVEEATMDETLMIPTHSENSFKLLYANKFKQYSSGFQTIELNERVDYSSISDVKQRRQTFLNLLTQKFSRPGWESISFSVNSCCCFFFDFCSALSILSSDHPFLSYFEQGKVLWSSGVDNFKRFAKLLCDIYYIMFTLQTGLPMDFDDMLPDLILYTLEPLFTRGNKHDFDDLRNQIEQYLRQIVESKPATIRDPEQQNMYEFLKSPFAERGAAFLMRPYNIAGFNGPDCANKEKAKTKNDNTKYWNKLKHYTQRVFANFTDYVIKEVMMPMRREIEPFSSKQIERNISILSYRTLRSLKDEYDFYIGQLKNLSKCFMFSYFCQCGMKDYEGVCMKIVHAFTKYYVHAKVINKVVFPYVYNIQQTPNLENMPYNQWILDSSNALDGWIVNILDRVIFPITTLSEFSSPGGLGSVMTLIYKTYPIFTIGGNGSTKNAELFMLMQPTSNLNTIKKNIKCNLNEYFTTIINTAEEQIKTYPAAYHTSYFAVRNGILEYVYDCDVCNSWQVRLLTNNHDKIIPSYSMARFTPNYNMTSNTYVDTVMGVLRDIYPIESEREYILDMFSTAVCPNIQKDEFLFMYGSGADGKSTVNSILRAMLGSTATQTCYENDTQIILTNPGGYCTSMESSTLGAEKKRGSADEGGTINLKDKTYCVIAEPPRAEIKSEVIKAWTGFNVIQSRGMYMASEEITVNCLIVCETNVDPTYDTVDDAIKRRIKVYQHKSKFITESNKDQHPFANKLFTHWADSDKINKIIKHVEYWEAFLHILVKHALKLLNNGVCTVSNIPAPLSVEAATQGSFKNSSTLSGWLEMNVKRNRRIIKQQDDTGNECTKSEMWGWVSASQLIDRIRRANRPKDGVRLTKASPHSSDATTITREIVNNLNAIYGGTLFKISREHIVEEGTSNIDANKVNELIEKANHMEVREFIDTYISGASSISDMNYSEFPESYLDILILGISFADEGVDNDSSMDLE